MNTNYHTHVEQDSESGEVCWVIWTQFPDLLKAEMIYCLFLPPGGHFLLFTQTALNVCISITAQIIFHIKPPYRNCQQHTDTLPQYTQLQSDVQMYPETSKVPNNAGTRREKLKICSSTTTPT